jgi:hypothetical protein
MGELKQFRKEKRAENQKQVLLVQRLTAVAYNAPVKLCCATHYSCTTGIRQPVMQHKPGKNKNSGGKERN